MTASAMPRSSRRRRARARRLRLRFRRRPSPKCSTICSASSWAGGAAAPPESRRATCATIWKSRWKRPSTARSAEIKVPTAVACEACSGIGAEAGSSAETCPTCAGHGKVRATAGLLHHRAHLPAPAAAPARSSAIPARPAAAPAWCRRSACSMSMCRRASRKARASACPAKARPASMAAPPGDLYIFLSVAASRIFQRDGHDLHCRAPVSFVTAALGGIDRSADPGRRPRQGLDPRRHPDGPAVPPRGKGMPVLRSGPAGRPLCRGRGRNPGQADQAAEGIAARVREGKRGREDQSRERKASSPRSRNSGRAPARREAPLMFARGASAGLTCHPLPSREVSSALARVDNFWCSFRGS